VVLREIAGKFLPYVSYKNPEKICIRFFSGFYLYPECFLFTAFSHSLPHKASKIFPAGQDMPIANYAENTTDYAKRSPENLLYAKVKYIPRSLW